MNRYIFISLLFVISFPTGSTAQYVSIPDLGFETFLINEGIDRSGIIDGKVLFSDIKDIKEMTIWAARDSVEIHSLKGLERFVSLEMLWISPSLGLKVDTVDVSKNQNLIFFESLNNAIKYLDVSNNRRLKHLTIQGSQLTSIDISACDSLVWLDCSSNLLDSFKITKEHPNLEGISIYDNLLVFASIEHIEFSEYFYFAATKNPYLYCIYIDSGSHWPYHFFLDDHAHFVEAGEECDTIIAVETPAHIGSITIHPNPVSGKLFLSIPGYNGKRVQLEVRDMMGQIVFEERNYFMGTSIDVSHWSPGLYFSTVKNNYSAVFTGRFIKVP